MIQDWLKKVDGLLWHSSGGPKVVRILIQAARITYVAGREFVADKCGLRASALTYYSTLSLVPILALLFGIAKGFGFQDSLRQNILDNVNQNQEIYLYLFDFAENTLRNARGGVVAGIGIVLLFYTLLRTISLVETSFNDIWKIKTPRSWIRKFTDYLSITLLAPFALIISSSATVFISTNVRSLSERNEVVEVIGPVLQLSLEFVPYLMIWILFLAIYMIMPNRRIQFSSALIGAIIAGTGYQLVEWAYITFQVGVSKYNGIYGSFAALPLFLIWVQTSWNIVLLGAELAYAHQNIDELTELKHKREFSTLETLKVAVMTMHVLARHYDDDKPFLTLKEIAKEVGVPQESLLQLLDDMEDKNLVVHVERMDEVSYQPARDRDQLSLSFIIKTMLGKDEGPASENHADVEAALKKLFEGMENGPNDRLLKSFN
ncbi:YihY/virulence factor BrkB family protein [bacterium SCSIO 12741]|nr:YihY/virulence factor BrkB family protein [bacterium SCSIO 12741]